MQQDKSANGILETWSVAEVAEAFAKDQIVLIDVRTVQEYSFEHIEGALLLPMAFFCPNKLPGQSDKQIVLYCGSSMRSGKMAQKTLDSGVPKIAHMEGGFGAWKAAGQPYIGTDMATGAPKAVVPERG